MSFREVRVSCWRISLLLGPISPITAYCVVISVIDTEEGRWSLSHPAAFVAILPGVIKWYLAEALKEGEIG